MIKHYAWAVTSRSNLGDPGIGITRIVGDGGTIATEDLIVLSDPQPAGWAEDDDGFVEADADALLAEMGWHRIEPWVASGGAWAAEVEPA